MIESRVDPDRRLTIHVCSGDLTAKEFIEAIERFYDLEPTPHNLWDLSHAKLAGLSLEAIREVAVSTHSKAPEREPGKTALVSSEDLAYGLAKMYSAFSEMTGHSATVEVFRSTEEADAWLAS